MGTQQAELDKMIAEIANHVKYLNDRSFNQLWQVVQTERERRHANRKFDLEFERAAERFEENNPHSDTRANR